MICFWGLELAVQVEESSYKSGQSHSNPHRQSSSNCSIFFELFFSGFPHIQLVGILGYRNVIGLEPSLRRSTNRAREVIRQFLERSALIVDISAISADVGAFGGHSHVNSRRGECD